MTMNVLRLNVDMMKLLVCHCPSKLQSHHSKISCCLHLISHKIYLNTDLKKKVLSSLYSEHHLIP